MLSDDTITLRTPTRDDAKTLIDAIRSSHAEINPWLPFATAEYDEDDAQHFLDLVEKGTERSFFVEDNEHTMHGVCGLNGFNDHRAANLGYWIRTASSGHGFATRAARLVAVWGLAELELQRVEIIAAVGNVASQRVAERAGFRAEGVRRNALRAHDVQHDVYVYSATPDDLDQLRGGVPG